MKDSLLWALKDEYDVGEFLHVDVPAIPEFTGDGKKIEMPEPEVPFPHLPTDPNDPNLPMEPQPNEKIANVWCSTFDHYHALSFL